MGVNESSKKIKSPSLGMFWAELVQTKLFCTMHKTPMEKGLMEILQVKREELRRAL